MSDHMHEALDELRQAIAQKRPFDFVDRCAEDCQKLGATYEQLIGALSAGLALRHTSSQTISCASKAVGSC